ncbi:MAG: class I SAM-dependent methyltransferase [Pseudomonadota bacterium]
MLKKFFSKEKPTLSTLPFKKSFDWNWGSVHFNRVALVNLLCASKLDGSYLEIGCQGNILFDAVPMTNKIGIDPKEGGTHKEYSDDFFIKNTEYFDVIFIDGLHVYDQVRRDVVNSIKFLKPDGWVAIHDMLPDDAISEHVPMISRGPWFGDVWKVAFELASSTGIEFKLIKIDAGVGLFRVTHPNATLNNLVDILQDKRFQYLYENIGQLPLVEWEDAYKWIRANS